MGNKGTPGSENRNTLWIVRDFELLNKIKMVITGVTWGDCEKCVRE
jgi:hypothetical protein